MLAILIAKKFNFYLSVDTIGYARSCVGLAKYKRGARMCQAPEVLDCSSFTKWLYGLHGIWIPRRSIQQRECGVDVEYDQIREKDLVFISGSIDYYMTDPTDGVGHVGIATGNGSVIHAANSKVGIIETPLEEFVGVGTFRGARRYIPENRKILVFATPPEREVETSDDIKWIILQSLEK